MSKVKFNADEMMVMAMFEQPTRTETMRYIEEVVPFVEDDVEVFSLVASTIRTPLLWLLALSAVVVLAFWLHLTRKIFL